MIEHLSNIKNNLLFKNHITDLFIHFRNDEHKLERDFGFVFLQKIKIMDLD